MTKPLPRPATQAQFSRVTKGRRKLTYVLTVIQQPERARACGSGAKSSSDRRPVDPPPVVEFRIYDDDGFKTRDVTLNYEATFFLCASLEATHPMSRSKVQPSNSQVPTLTGINVSSMSYLDRPSEAGYFIFSDLSVRHEGQYILNFNLYEESKNERDQDFDHMPSAATDPASPDSFYDWRLEVKSLPFTVYSAKKFPGLSESTHLSRIVAEQGCRVRIRRDVRMRRRDPKVDGNLIFDGYNRHEDEEEAFRERTRSQSLSGSSESSRFSPTEVNSLAVQSHNPLTPSQPIATRSSRHLPFPDPNYRHHGAHHNVTKFLFQPAIILPPTHTKPFHATASPHLHLENRSFLPPVYPLSPPLNARDDEAKYNKLSMCKNELSNDAPAPTRQNPIHPPRTSASLSIDKLLSPIKLPSDKPAPPKRLEIELAPIKFSHEEKEAALYASEKPQPKGSKRSISISHPDDKISKYTRLFHGHRPSNNPSHNPDVEITELERNERLMVYRRASGAIRVRESPIFN